MISYIRTGLLGVGCAIMAFQGGIYCKSISRRNYCVQACSDARTCGFFPLPANCETSCEHGTRTIELPRTCEQLKKNVDKAGFLW